jgi:uncharacterized protein (TIGR02996 family)
MPTEADFLRAIVADPDADAPRLAYADWREECGDAARAEFIRVQCALATLHEDERTYHPLREREEALLTANYLQWFAPVLHILRDRSSGLGGWLRRLGGPKTSPRGFFRRGFVEELSTALPNYLDHAAELAASIPLRSLFGSLDGQTASEPIRRLGDCPHIRRLNTLELRATDLTGEDVRQLAESPHLFHLRELSLSGMPTAGVELLANSALLERLERLELDFGLQLTDEPADLAALFQSPVSQGLSSLALTGAGLTARHLSAALPFPNMPRLSRLDLHSNPLEEEGFDTIPERLPPTLTELDLKHTLIGDHAAATLSASPLLRSLRNLNLAGNVITDIGAMMLADSPYLLASTRLNLSGNLLTPRVQNALRIRLGHHVVV